MISKKILIWISLCSLLFSCQDIQNLNTSNLVQIEHKWITESINPKLLETFRNKYEAVWTYTWGIAKVKSWSLYWYINTEWKEIIPLEYSFLWKYKSWGIVAMQNKKMWLLSGTGEIIIPFEYNYITTEISDDWLVAVQLKDTYSFFNTQGQQLSPFFTGKLYTDDIRDWMLEVYPDGLAGSRQRVDITWKPKRIGSYEIGGTEASSRKYWIYLVDDGNNFGFIDSNGKLLTPFKYCGWSMEFTEWVTRVCLMGEGKYWFLNYKWQEIHKRTYEDAGSCNNERCLIGINGKKGYIDLTWNEIIPPIYDSVTDFSENRSIVVTYKPWVKLCTIEDTMGSWNNRNCWIDRKDKIIKMIDTSWKTIVDIFYDKIGSMHDNRSPVSSGSKIWFIDSWGKLVIPIDYDYDGSYFDDVSYMSYWTDPIHNNFWNWFVLAKKNWVTMILYPDWFERVIPSH